LWYGLFLHILIFAVAYGAVVADYDNWGYRGSGRGRPRGEMGAGDGADRRNMSEMVNASNFHLYFSQLW